MSLPLPQDDDGIDMEEIEGLINVNTPSSGRILSDASPLAALEDRVAALESSILSRRMKALEKTWASPQNKTRKISVFVLILAILVVVFMAGDLMELIVAEEDVAEGDVEEKPAEDFLLSSESAVVVEGTETKAETADENLTEEQKTTMEKWGRWKFYDGGEAIRPKEDYCAAYPNRDIPGDAFPENAWQTDAVYVNHFLNEATKLVERAMEAIYAEYGLGKPDPSSTLTPELTSARKAMFGFTILDPSKQGQPGGKFGPQNAGWVTQPAFDGLVRRLLHAMMTKDTFTVVLGGHSAAAGHGNHFKQSYMMQFHDVMEPVFRRLGVKLITRNIAQGGLGTMQGALGSGSIYGDEVDIILWDSSMTERDAASMDLFARQALLGGKRAPLILGGNFAALKMLHQNVKADVGFFGTGAGGLPVTQDEDQAKTIPWAARFMKCAAQQQILCNANKYRTRCWIDRPDVKPPKPQRKYAAGQVSWHPGFRTHRLTGRVIAFIVLEALEDAISIWSEKTILGGHPLPDDFWHMTDKINSIQNATKHLDLDPKLGMCESLEKFFPKRVCNTGMKARTEFTPRANPEQTSLLTLVKPAANGYIPKYVGKMLYEGPDVPNPALQIPENEIDVRAIVSNRRMDTGRSLLLQNATQPQWLPKEDKWHPLRNHRLLDDKVVPGLGWSMDPNIPPGNCDGTYDAICGRLPESDCLLSGHMDARGGMFGDGYSGWLVMNLKGVKEGIILLKYHSWLPANAATRTNGWKSINNQRRLLCDKFEFHYAVNGQITSLNLTEFQERNKVPQRVVEIFTILDDEEMAKKGQEQDIEVAVRVGGCARQSGLSITHIYWA